MIALFENAGPDGGMRILVAAVYAGFNRGTTSTDALNGPRHAQGGN